MDLSYQRGFGNHFWSEAKAGAIPQDRHSPQRVAHGLYAEHFSGTAFTVPRGHNLTSWLYRIYPSAAQGLYSQIKHEAFCPSEEAPAPPNPMRWNPLPLGTSKQDWLAGSIRLLGSTGCNVFIYSCNVSMRDSYFMNSDGEFLFIPEHGGIILHTEFGSLEVPPLYIAVVPRGIKFSVELMAEQARGYVVENLEAVFKLPDLGPIGANGLAYPEHFEAPVARFEDREGKFRITTKFNDRLWSAVLDHSPFDVVGWHGNLAPYRYDLSKFQTIGAISFDHPDPSIFTVLTAPSDTPGVANCDFVIFPPRWLVNENTFRPPWYHRNIMSEFMGLIHGVYDAKESGGFVPGGGSLHNRMVPHGPDTGVLERAASAELKPHKIDRTMAFMAETRHLFKPTPFALKLAGQDGGLLQPDYHECWAGIPKGWKG